MGYFEIFLGAVILGACIWMVKKCNEMIRTSDKEDYEP